MVVPWFPVSLPPGALPVTKKKSTSGTDAAHLDAWARWLVAWRADPARAQEELRALAAWGEDGAGEVVRVVAAWGALQLAGPFPPGEVPAEAWAAHRSAWAWLAGDVRTQVVGRLAVLAGCGYAVAARVVETGVATGLFSPDGTLGPAGLRLIQFHAQKAARTVRGRGGRSAWGGSGTPET